MRFQKVPEALSERDVDEAWAVPPSDARSVGNYSSAPTKAVNFSKKSSETQRS
jgi:hypothetical protein